MSWSVDALWTGGYESDCKWYGKMTGTLEIGRLPFVEPVLALLFGAFAVAVKIAIVERLKSET
jgi:hypothetical protein